MSSDRRNYFFDFIKAFAIFIVLSDHFVGSFAAQYYDIFPLSIIFKVFYGKFGVSLFAIVSGYFAYHSGKKNDDSVIYILKRYLFFFVSCLITNSLYYAINMNNIRDISSIGMVIGQSVTLGDYFCPSFWFMKEFLLGSIIVHKMGKLDMKLSDSIIVLIVMLMCKQIFIASTIAGAILYHIMKNEYSFFDNIVVKVILITILLSFIIYRPEGKNLRYLLNTVRAMAFILLIYRCRFMEIFDNKLTSLIGSKTIAILTSHLPVTVWFINLNLDLPLAVKYLLWLVASIVFSVPIDFMVRTLTRYLLFFLEKILDTFPMSKR